MEPEEDVAPREGETAGAVSDALPGPDAGALEAVRTVHALLDLLHREAPASDFDAVVARARHTPASPASPAVLAALDAAHASALRLRDVLAERSRREAELAALNETAADLAALRDPDQVLRAIVHRARMLLGTDTAYLSLHDPEAGDTYIRVTAGSVSARFQRLRLALGEGIGGLVAQQGTPYVTSDYFADGDFRHTHVIDDGVRDEGLVAMIAVPLVAGGNVLGVLWASDRRPRVFRPTEVSLLCAFAAHAAVALDSARLWEESRDALADLARANLRAQAHSASVERAAEAHDRFTELVVAGAGVEDVVRAVADVVGGTADLLPATADVEDPELVASRATALATGRAAHVGKFHAVPVVAGTENLGLLVVRGDGNRPPDAADTRILERAAMIVALLLLFRRSVTAAESRLRGELVHDILAGPSELLLDVGRLTDRAARLGADLTVAHVVVVADVPGADRLRLEAAAAHLAATAHGLAGTVGAHTVLLLPAPDARVAARQVSAELTAALGRPATAGAAGPSPAPGGLRDAYAEAARCLAALHALGRKGEGACVDELGFVGLLLARAGNESSQIDVFVHRTLGPLLDYDRTRGAELTHTVAVFLETGASLTRTRDALHVHVNTVAQRLERVSHLLGDDWRTPARELQIRLALHLRSLLPDPVRHVARQPETSRMDPLH